jgi:Glycosyl transferase 4-like domain/Glycosyl transferases group 1
LRERIELRLLLLSFYYPPDLSAGSFRASALVESLLAMLPPGATIEVITTAPNRYSTFTQEVMGVERRGPLTIRRIALPAHRSDLWGQSRAFAQFARQANRWAAAASYDVVFATSSRLMTAALGARIARRQGARLYLDIRDIFVDTIGDVFPKMAGILKPALSAVERRTMSRADRINLVSRGFEDYFMSRYPDRSYRWFTNGIDDEFLGKDWSREKKAAGAPRALEVVYAGNIGEGQGLHAILPQLALWLGDRAHFRVIGDGGRRELLLERLRHAGVHTVEILPPMPRSGLLEAYAKADILFLHLNALAAFEKVLPSKIFEYAATGKPIWAGVAGYAARFIAAEVSNAAVFTPCDASDAVAKLDGLSLLYQPRDGFVSRYARRNIAAEMAADVLALAAVSP